MDTVVRAWRGLAWWMRGVVGANAYEQYLASHHRRGHDHAPMTEREFWRARIDHQERNPQGRCC
ncbi:YbdD/YjiX family protein [Actinomycetospora rhizophila]|uniref:YbdD/YjiX family protein n=1 Tax=Actinomycetospora rhizophila TaxID=1416876 RepID=A0ABV9Z6D7_9PSEU